MKKVLIAAMTLDGKIARHAVHDVNWTSKEDKNFFREETKKAGVVIFGTNTYKAIGRPIPDRLNIIMTRDLEKYSAKTIRGLLEFTSDSPKVILDKLVQRGYEKVVIGGGSAIYFLFLKEKLIDEVYLTLIPKIFGKGIGLFKGLNSGFNLDGFDEVDLELIDISKLGIGEILLKYKVKYRGD